MACPCCQSDPCASQCDGTGRPSVVYVEITDFQLSTSAPGYLSNIPNVNGTYALDRKADSCTLWVGPDFGDGCMPSFIPERSFVETGTPRVREGYDMVLTIRTSWVANGARYCFNTLALPVALNTMPAICGSGVIASGSSSGLGTIYLERFSGYGFAGTATCTFNWKVSA